MLDASAAESFNAYPGEWESVSALRGAGVGRGQMLHRLMVTRLAAEYGGRFGCVLVDMRPTELARIPTSWYLDQEARGSMRRHFGSARWSSQRRSADRGGLRGGGRRQRRRREHHLLPRPPSAVLRAPGVYVVKNQ